MHNTPRSSCTNTSEHMYPAVLVQKTNHDMDYEHTALLQYSESKTLLESRVVWGISWGHSKCLQSRLTRSRLPGTELRELRKSQPLGFGFLRSLKKQLISLLRQSPRFPSNYYSPSSSSSKTWVQNHIEIFCWPGAPACSECYVGSTCNSA